MSVGSGRVQSVVTVVVACAMATTLLHPCLGFAEDQSVQFNPVAQQAAGITIETGIEGSVARPINSLGKIITPGDREVNIQPAGSGKVLSINVFPGEHVRAGQVLLTYQNHSLHLVRLQLQKMKAALSTAVAAQAEAIASYDRAKVLVGQSIAVGELMRRRAILQAANDDVVAREADLATLRHQLDEEYNSVTEADNRSETSDDETSRILSPIEGEIRSIGTAIADDIEPSLVVMNVTNLSQVWIAADVLPAEALLVDPQGNQENELPNGRLIRSRIISISSVADPTTGLVRIISSVDNIGNKLRPGDMMNVRLPSADKVKGIILPADAVVALGGQPVVFVSDGKNQFFIRKVKVGLETPDQVVVTSGLKSTEKVVSHGAFALKATLVMTALAPDSD